MTASPRSSREITSSASARAVWRARRGGYGEARARREAGPAVREEQRMIRTPVRVEAQFLCHLHEVAQRRPIAAWPAHDAEPDRLPPGRHPRVSARDVDDGLRGRFSHIAPPLHRRYRPPPP